MTNLTNSTSLLKHFDIDFFLFKGSDNERDLLLPKHATETSLDLLGRSNFFKPTTFLLKIQNPCYLSKS